MYYVLSDIDFFMSSCYVTQLIYNAASAR